MSTIVGREAELASVEAFLADAGRRLSALHLHGEAGIGKSTVWQAALAEAERIGCRVVSTRPTEAEAQLPFAGLNDLFGTLLDEVQPELPLPQRLALDIALLRADPGPQPPEPLAISLAILGLVRVSAADRPLVVAIDDAPWLDASSAGVLEFVLRRLDSEPVGVLVAERTADGGLVSAPLVSSVSADRLRTQRVAPLSMEAIQQLLLSTLGLDLAPSSVSRVHRTTGGNPFYAIEIGRALQRRGIGAVGGEMPLPESLATLVRDRLEALPEEAAHVIAHAAALSQPTTEILVAALDEAVARGLDQAVSAAVVAVDDAGLVRFSHPLLAAEAYSRVGPSDRQAMHLRLASALTEPEERARHLALGTDQPDERVAEQLERAAEHAEARGALAAAADLAGHAVALTPAEHPSRVRRRTLTGRCRMLAGDTESAQAELEVALSEAPAGISRATVLLRLGEVRMMEGDWQVAGDLFSSALGEASDDVRLTIQIKHALVGYSHITGRDWDAGTQHVADAMRLADELGDPAIVAGMIGPHAWWQYITGRGRSVDLERRVADLEPWTGHLRSVDHPLKDLSDIWQYEGAWDRAIDARKRLLQRAEQRGDYSSIGLLLTDSTWWDLYSGRITDVHEHLDRAERLARAVGQRSALMHALMFRAVAHARAGEAGEAWEVARSIAKLAAETGMVAYSGKLLEELALLELSRKDPAAAHQVLGAGAPWAASGTSPFPQVVSPVDAEALVGMGRLDEARGVLDAYERNPSPTLWPLGSAWPHANASRARALLAAAEGNLEDATRLAAEAVDTYRRLGGRFHEALGLLVSGEVHRRARRRARAREAFSTAAALFTGLGAELWAAQAREQLERLSSARHDRAGLTPTQTEVADLAIEGLTNRQIADRLFMSIHTVEAHLSAVYRTLGIGSRRDLPRALGNAEAPIRDTAGSVGDSPSGSTAES
jgi:DNA-binding CsgD family transcriptional regulator